MLLSIQAIRQAAKQDKSRSATIYGAGGLEARAHLYAAGVVAGRPTGADERLDMLERQVAELQKRVQEMPDEWATALRDRVALLAGETYANVRRQIDDAINDVRMLAAPLTRDWKRARSSAVLLVAGIVAQTIGGILALYA